MTADWGAILENSKAYEDVSDHMRGLVRAEIESEHKSQVATAKARHAKEIKRRLLELPEHRRRAAQEAVERVLKRFPNDRDDRIQTILAVTFDAYEMDDYWSVIKAIGESSNADVATVADALSDFGLVDMAVTAQQAQTRLSVLDGLGRLIENANTLEKEVHAVVESNPWILGNRFNVLRSEESLQKILGDLAPRGRGRKRPDLFLGALPGGEHVLIEFKRPSHDITRKDETQAKEYRDNLLRQFDPIEVLVIGRGRHPDLDPRYKTDGLEILSWARVVSQARLEIRWLLDHLKSA